MLGGKCAFIKRCFVYWRYCVTCLSSITNDVTKAWVSILLFSFTILQVMIHLSVHAETIIGESGFKFTCSFERSLQTAVLLGADHISHNLNNSIIFMRVLPLKVNKQNKKKMRRKQNDKETQNYLEAHNVKLKKKDQHFLP